MLWATASAAVPISDEYVGRPSFDLAEKYGKDTFASVKHAGSREQIKPLALKNWVNGVFAKVPFFGQAVADSIAQGVFGLPPQRLPKRMLDIRDRFEYHLLLVESGSQKNEAEEFLKAFFAVAGHDGAFFLCTDDEAQSAMLHRFGAASAATRCFNLNRAESSDMIAFDFALKRDDDEWLDVLSQEVVDALRWRGCGRAAAMCTVGPVVVVAQVSSLQRFLALMF